MNLLCDAAPEWLREQVDEAIQSELDYTLQSPVLARWWAHPSRVTVDFTILDEQRTPEDEVVSTVEPLIPSVYEYNGVTYKLDAEVSYDPPDETYPAHGNVTAVVSLQPSSSVGSFSHRQA